ncbi:MAG: InlB B-repeat-containing protein [Bacilli bacterium]
MQKLARKTLLSIFAVAITIIAIGAITFAWFTMTTIADVDSFDTDIRAESGIEISLDCQSFASYIRKDVIVNQIKNNLLIEEGPIVLNPVTTANGFSNFRTISQYNGTPILEEVGEDGAKWIWFNLYFRTPEKSTYVYLLDDTELSSDGRPWKADVTFNDTATHVVHTGETKMIYAANALRMSFLTCDMDLSKIDAGEEPIGNEPKSVVIYELDPTYGTPPRQNEMNNRLDQMIKQGYGLIEYFRIKNGGSIDDPDSGINLADYFDNGVLPQNVLNNENLVSAAKLNETRSVIEGEKAAILSFDEENYHEDTGYYYGAVKVQMWIEGWDPDSYNAIHMADLQIKLSFGGTKQRPSIDSTLIDPTKEYDIEYIWEPGYGIPQNPNPATIKAYELPMFLKPAALEGYVFDGWYLTYEAGGPGEQGAYSDRVNYLPRDFAPESGEGIKLYGKLREFNINYDLVHEFNEAAELDELLTPKSYVGKDLDQLSIALPVPGTYTTGSGDMEIIYNFLGWYLNPEYMGNPVTVINNLINAVPGDITLYAKWEAEYKITYDFNEHEGADNPNPATVKTSELPLSLQPASLYGYAFLGWYLDSDFSGDSVSSVSKGITEDLILYGKFGDYEINYDLGVGEGAVTLPDGFPEGYNAATLPIALPDLEDFIEGEAEEAVRYAFAGWYTDPDFSGSAITAIDEGIPFADLTLYAKWDIVEEYAISYDFGGLESVDNPNPETIAISDLPFELLPATLAGYEFVGWYLDPDYSGEPVTSIPAGLTEGMALYGKFEVAP